MAISLLAVCLRDLGVYGLHLLSSNFRRVNRDNAKLDVSRIEHVDQRDACTLFSFAAALAVAGHASDRRRTTPTGPRPMMAIVNTWSSAFNGTETPLSSRAAPELWGYDLDVSIGKVFGWFSP